MPEAWLTGFDLALTCAAAALIVPALWRSAGTRVLCALLLAAVLLLVWGSIQGITRDETLAQHLRRELISALLLSAAYRAMRL